MVQNLTIEIVKIVIEALGKMDKCHCRLSAYDYAEDQLKHDNKFYERPITYEFYHQLRIMIDDGAKCLKGYNLHAEVIKGYQNYPIGAKAPDFILHKSDTSDNLAVIEFKRTKMLKDEKNGIKNDFDKLTRFLTEEPKYKHAIEVIIGKDERDIDNAKKYLEETYKYEKNGVKIIIVWFDFKEFEVIDKDVFQFCFA